MPFKKDPENGGTEKEGERSKKYCSYCYKNGEFLNPEINTPQKMQKFCMEMMNKSNMPKFVAWIFTRSIPKLERWKKH